MSRWRIGKPITISVFNRGAPWRHYLGTGVLMFGLHCFSNQLRDFPDEHTPLKLITLIILAICVWRKDIAPTVCRRGRGRARIR